ncbi:multiple sugar transport system permease protein [Curtobacterium pusillum]|uniref:Multiple sugar transport system permease protein n=1 Tax=Curtobacterium pusillum TaxID=69373 RepID=A0AAW3T755_9MICO|nr:carbohydrate ABC transporter permease [Curtobacterium pusillum]MBA8990781.1 multiple sugar transport system permease protein [Curtobacterium pusillum]
MSATDVTRRTTAASLREASRASSPDAVDRIGAPKATPHRRRRTPHASEIAYFVVGTVLALLFIAPIVYILFRSFLPANADARGIGLDSLATLTLRNYTKVFDPSVDLRQNIVNSLIVAIAVAVLVALVSTLAAYALSKIRFRGSTTVFVLLLAPLVVPFQGLLTPLSIVLGKLGLLDSLAGVVLVLVTLQVPFSVFVMRNTFDSIPPELEDAAAIDGAGTGRILRSVMLPLAWPGLVTVALFGFMAGWNDLLSSVTFLSTDSKYTLPLALSSISTSFKIPGVPVIDPGLLTAVACVATVPVVVLFLALQRYYTKGLIGGSIK